MRHKKGFLLVEVAIVIALLLFIITLALPPFAFLKKQLLTSEIQKLMSVCFYLRQCALVTNKDQILTFDLAKSCYTANNTIHTLSNGIRFGFLPNTYGPPSKPQSLITQPMTFRNNQIVFHADGTISSGTLYFVDTTQHYFFALTTPSGQLPFLRMYEYQHRWLLHS